MEAAFLSEPRAIFDELLQVAKVESFFRCKEAVFLSELRSLSKRVDAFEQGKQDCEEAHQMLSDTVRETHTDLSSVSERLIGTKGGQLLADMFVFAQSVDDLRSFIMTNAQVRSLFLAHLALSCDDARGT